MFLKKRNISSKIKISKVTDYAALKIKIFLLLELSDVVFIMLINVKIPTIVGFLSRESLYKCIERPCFSIYEHNKFHVQLS